MALECDSQVKMDKQYKTLKEFCSLSNSLELKILPLTLFCPNLNIIIYYFKLVYGTGIILR